MDQEGQRRQAWVAKVEDEVLEIVKQKILHNLFPLSSVFLLAYYTLQFKLQDNTDPWWCTWIRMQQSDKTLKDLTVKIASSQAAVYQLPFKWNCSSYHAAPPHPHPPKPSPSLTSCCCVMIFQAQTHLFPPWPVICMCGQAVEQSTLCQANSSLFVAANHSTRGIVMTSWKESNILQQIASLSLLAVNFLPHASTLR